jgi:hypothetical protein
MNRQEGAPLSASYSRVTANDNLSEGTKRPTFEPPPELREKLLMEGSFKDREMEIDPTKEKAPASTPWLSGKCIP